MNNNDKKISWNNKIMNKFTKIKKLQITGSIVTERLTNFLNKIIVSSEDTLKELNFSCKQNQKYCPEKEHHLKGYVVKMLNFLVYQLV